MASTTSNKGTCEPVARNSVTANKITLILWLLSRKRPFVNSFGPEKKLKGLHPALLITRAKE
jgi:hypothetical protein